MKNHRILGSSLLVVFLAILLALGACQNPIAEAAQAIKAAAASPTASITTPSGADLASGAGLDLGSVGLSATKDLSLTITNSGKTALVIDPLGTSLSLGAGTEPGAITIVSLPTSIEPGASASVILRLTRQASSGTKTATLVLKTNDVSHPDITLKVSGVSLDGMAKDITAFSFADINAPGVISGTGITIFVPDDGTQVAMRSPVFEHTGSKIAVDGIDQTSGDATSPQDFTSPVTYRVTSLDGLSYKDYVVTVVRNPKAPTLVPHDRTIEASWTAVPNASGYQVWYYAGTDPAKAAKFGPSVTSGTTASITGLTNGVSYTVWIKAEYGNGSVSGLGLASAPATVNIKYFGWLFGGDSTGVKRYSLSVTDGSITGGGTLVSNDLSSNGGIVAMAVDRARGLLFFGYRKSNNTNDPFMVQSAKIDPRTGSLTEGTSFETNWTHLYSLTLSPDGKHLYAANGYITGGELRYWDVDQTTGVLSNQRSAPTKDRSGSSYDARWYMGMAAHPSRNVLYVVGYSYAPYSPGINYFSIDPSTGNLTFEGHLATGDYPMDVAVAPNSNRLVVSFQATASTATCAVASYPLDSSGFPLLANHDETPLDSPAKADWATVVVAPVAGSSSNDHVFVLDNWTAQYVRDLAVTPEGLSYKGGQTSTGSQTKDADIVALPTGSASYLYKANIAGSIFKFTLGSVEGSLTGQTDTAYGGGTAALRGLFLPW